MSDSASPVGEHSRLFPKSPMAPLALGLILLAGYLSIAAEYDQFFDPNLTYAGYGLTPLAPLPYSTMRNFSPFRLSQMYWEMLLLFPATVCLALSGAYAMSAERSRRLLDALRGFRPPWSLALSCIALGGLFAFWALVIFQGMPLTDDERVYEFQALTLLAGRLVNPAPPGGPAFEGIFVDIINGLWMGRYTIGHPLILAAGGLLGSQRVFTILLPALAPILVYWIGREQYGEKTGRLAAALFLVSPFFLMAGATTLPHGSMIFLLALFTLAHWKTRAGSGWHWPVIAGLALGFSFNLRPQSMAAYAAPFAVWSLCLIIAQPRRQAGRQLLMLACCLAMMSLTFYYNQKVTGGPFTFPNASGGLPFGFQIAKTRVYQHSLAHGVANFFINGARMNLWLFGWPFSLLFVFLYLLRGRLRAWDWSYLGIVAASFILLVGYRFPGEAETGPRYYFDLLIPLTLFSARGMLIAHEYCARRWTAARPRGETLVPLFVFLSVLFSLSFFYKERALYYLHLTDNIARPYRAVEEAGLRNAIVRMDSVPLTGWLLGTRVNSPELNEDVLYARLTEPRNLLELMDAMPDRAMYSLRYEPGPDGGDIIIEPLTRSQLQAEQAQYEQERAAKDADNSAQSAALADPTGGAQ